MGWRKTIACFLVLPVAVVAILSAEVAALGIPLTRVEGEWAPALAHDIQIVAMRMEVIPSMDDSADQLVWVLDTTLVVRNFGSTEQTLEMGIPNIWSANDSSVTPDLQEFWGEAFVNGVPAETEVVRLIRSPAHLQVTYRAAKRFSFDLGPDESAQLRFRYALPSAEGDGPEVRLLLPFHLRTLWDGAIDHGSITVRWTGRMNSFRTNLPSYALYPDRAEWFVRGFEPENDLEVRFLPRQALFVMVAREMSCPMPWELMDRVTAGDPAEVTAMLEPYPSDVLDICASLPPLLRGSEAAARQIGLNNLTIERFAPEGSGFSGPLFVPDPDFAMDQLSESEGIYVRFLRQTIDGRQ